MAASDSLICLSTYGTKIIYRTQALGSLPMQLRKIAKNRGHFPSDKAANKSLFLTLRNIERIGRCLLSSSGKLLINSLLSSANGSLPPFTATFYTNPQPTKSLTRPGNHAPRCNRASSSKRVSSSSCNTPSRSTGRVSMRTRPLSSTSTCSPPASKSDHISLP